MGRPHLIKEIRLPAKFPVSRSEYIILNLSQIRKVQLPKRKSTSVTREHICSNVWNHVTFSKSCCMIFWWHKTDRAAETAGSRMPGSDRCFRYQVITRYRSHRLIFQKFTHRSSDHTAVRSYQALKAQAQAQNVQTHTNSVLMVYH